ncbi:hypothetical protein, partial [Pseudomonas syringae group genomosp. 3]|uniref:hypothetical protein n=1 Tax=Pseudomonas syringae group genomosp. 3 TaxID=251701 RepID=UPI000AE4FBD7
GQKRVICADRATLRLSASLPECRSGPGDASFVRELPGTGSKTSRLGVPDTTEVTGLGAASQPIADKSPTPSGQKRVICADRATLRLSANLPECRSGPGDASFVRELPGTGSETSRLGVPDTTEVTGLGAASQPS